MLSAIARGDAKAAEELMAAAIAAFRDDLVATLQRAAMGMPLPGRAS